jgi:hypothetical protein
LHVPELLAMVLDHVDVWDPAILRVSKAFQHHLHPKLYRVVELSSAKTNVRHRLLFLRTLEPRPLAVRLERYEIQELRIALNEHDLAVGFLKRLAEVYAETRGPFSQRLRTLTIKFDFSLEYDIDDDDLDRWLQECGGSIAQFVMDCPKLSSVVLPRHLEAGLVGDSFIRTLQRQDRQRGIRRRLAKFTLTILSDEFFPEDWPTRQIGLTVKIACNPTAKDGVQASSIRKVMNKAVRGKPPAFKKLIFGPGMVWRVKKQTVREKLEWALVVLASRASSNLAAFFVMEFPEELDEIMDLLDDDPLFQEGGFEACYSAWNRAEWPAAAPAMTAPVQTTAAQPETGLG